MSGRQFLRGLNIREVKRLFLTSQEPQMKEGQRDPTSETNSYKMCFVLETIIRCEVVFRKLE